MYPMYPMYPNVPECTRGYHAIAVLPGVKRAGNLAFDMALQKHDLRDVVKPAEIFQQTNKRNL